MRPVDWTVVAVYMTATLAIGLWLARRASRSLEDFFVGGRTIPWWLAGASMAAITFSVDTPLYRYRVHARGTSADQLREAARRYLDAGNYARFVLLPARATTP